VTGRVVRVRPHFDAADTVCRDLDIRQQQRLARHGVSVACQQQAMGIENSDLDPIQVRRQHIGAARIHRHPEGLPSAGEKGPGIEIVGQRRQAATRHFAPSKGPAIGKRRIDPCQPRFLMPTVSAGATIQVPSGEMPSSGAYNPRCFLPNPSSRSDPTHNRK